MASSASTPATFTDATAASRIDFVFEASRTSAKYLIEAMAAAWQ